MRITYWILLSGIFFTQQSFSQEQSCVHLIPNKRDYMVSTDLLREVISCVESNMPKPVQQDTMRTAIHFDGQTYLLPLVGQSTLFIRQLDMPEQTYQYQIVFYDESGKVLKKMSKAVKNNKIEAINLNKEKVIKANYAILKIALGVDQKSPMTIIFAT